MEAPLLIHPIETTGRSQLDWLDSRHYFSFGEYFNPRKVGFGKLRVINDDIIKAHRGFGLHAHANMEIVTVVLSGSITHEDSLGNNGTISAGEVQRMSAGTGILHSEMNEGDTDVHLYQIWIHPKSLTEPGYQQMRLPRRDGLVLVASPDGKNNSLLINQSAYIWKGSFGKGQRLGYTLEKSGNIVYALLIQGKLKIDNLTIEKGSAIEHFVDAVTVEDSEILIFEVPR